MKSWSVPETDKLLFQQTFDECIDKSNEELAHLIHSVNVENISKGIQGAFIASLKVASKKTSFKESSKELPASVLEVDKKIKALNKDIYILYRKLHIKDKKEDTLQKLISLEEQVKKSIEFKAILQLDLNREKDKKSHKILKTKGQKSKRFWREIKPRESTRINSLKKEDGSQSQSPEDTLETAQKYFQELFSKQPNKTNRKPQSYSNVNLGRSRRLIRKLKVQTVRTYLNRLKKDKAAGPDGIKN